MTSVPILGGDNLFEQQFLFMSMSNVMDIVLLIPNIIKHRFGFIVDIRRCWRLFNDLQDRWDASWAVICPATS